MTQKYKVLGQPDTYYSIPPAIIPSAPADVWYDITPSSNYMLNEARGHMPDKATISFVDGVGYTSNDTGYGLYNQLKFIIEGDYNQYFNASANMLWDGVRPTKIRVTTDASLIQIYDTLGNPLLPEISQDGYSPFISGVPITFTAPQNIAEINLQGLWSFVSKIEINTPLNVLG